MTLRKGFLCRRRATSVKVGHACQWVALNLWPQEGGVDTPLLPRFLISLPPPPAAVKAIRRSIAAEPSCARAHFHLATCLSEMGLQHFDDAIVSYRTAIMLSSAARDDLLVEVLTDFVSHSSRHLLRIVTSFTLDLT